MTVALADGPLGIEARHKWTNMATATTLATLGDLSTFPNARITDISGLFDFPDIEDNSEPATEAIGLVPYPSRARGKNVIYTIEVRGRTLQEMRAHGAALRAGFGPDVTTGLSVVRAMFITPHPTYGTPEHVYQARCLSWAQGQDRQDRGPGASPTPYVRTVVIGLRMYDPRVYEWNAATEIGFENPKW